MGQGKYLQEMLERRKNVRFYTVSGCGQAAQLVRGVVFLGGMCYNGKKLKEHNYEKTDTISHLIHHSSGRL